MVSNTVVTMALKCIFVQSGGTFTVTVTATLTATLNDVYACATSSSSWFKDPYNWVPNYNRNSRNFLNKLETNFTGYADLQTCADMFISNPNGLFSVYSQQWTCPSNNANTILGFHLSIFISAALPLLVVLRFR